MQSDSLYNLQAQIARVKTSTTSEKLCEGLPKQILEMLYYVKGMKFEDAPDFPKLRGYIESMAKQYDFTLKENIFDWVIRLLNVDAIGIKNKEGLLVKYKLTPQQHAQVSQWHIKNYGQVVDMQYEMQNIIERARQKEEFEERKNSGDKNEEERCSMDERSIPLENDCVRTKNKHLKRNRPLNYKASKLYEPLDSDEENSHRMRMIKNNLSQNQS